MKQSYLFLILGIVSCYFLFSLSPSLNHEISTYNSVSEDSLERAEASVELGRFLFYDKVMSRDSSLSCASCHLQNLAFTDGEKTSIGFKGQRVTRNSPTLINVLNRKMFLLDGVNPSLESQVTVPIQEHKEFDFHILLIANRLNTNPRYVELSKKAFGKIPDPEVITKSIASFERKIVANDSPYDRFQRGNKKALSKSAKRGEKLFFDELYCGKCHTGSDLTNDEVSNNGLYKNYADKGRYRLTEKQEDIAVFKVPTLRNITMTAPYMHDGSLKTLQEVLAHYQTGGANHQNKSKIIQPFTLTKKEEKDLMSFFHSLTDSTILYNPELSSPFEN